MRDVHALLLDIDGVLYEGEKPVPGAVDAVNRLVERYPVRFITNTTRKSRDIVLKKLKSMGFAVDSDSIFTALDAAADFLERKGAKGYFLLYEPVASMFDAYLGTKPDYVVVADAYTDFTYEKLNRAFRYLMDGAQLLAIAKNRYFKDSDGALSLDAGGFVALLEFAAQKEALILGKPSENFFRLASASMNLEPKYVLMVGDDIESDVAGAQKAGMRACQVKTGKFRAEDLKGNIVPDCLLDSIADLPKLLESSC